MAYSKDFRLKVLAFVDHGDSQAAVARGFEIGERTARSFKQSRRLTGDVTADKTGLNASRTHKYLSLISLRPAILKRALTGHLPPRATLTNLLQAAEYLDWQTQRIYLNLDESSHPG